MWISGAYSVGDVNRYVHYDIHYLNPDVQLTEEFFSWPNSKMSKNKSSAKSTLVLQKKDAQTVYEDSESDNSDIELLKGGESFGHRDGEGSGWRFEKRRRYKYDSDIDHYRSPNRRRKGRSSPPARFRDYSSRKGEVHQRLEDGPGSSRSRRDRSITPEAYEHDSRGHSGNGRVYEDRRGRHYSWYEKDSLRRETPEKRGRVKREKLSPERPEPQHVGSRVSEKK